MKRRIKTLLIASVAALAFTACSQSEKTDENNKIFRVASENRDCVGVGRQKCLLVKQEDESEWSYFYSSINGFDYTPGYEYKLEVKTDKISNPPADASSIKYTLVRQISKEKKQSDRLPN